ncbi:MAG TPA: excinuclease ABC subunit UvrC [Candidatus Krumholzibacteria bacterium]|nr:excinuclease ABC subunit UvrC [Candidatus Krumholzibacteria bacterium]
MSRNPESNDDRQALEAKLKLLPASPGVYLHKDAQGKVLYVGKALHLNQRVRSYFQDAADHAPRIRDLVRRVRDFDYIVTATEAEALVLEDQLIKEYRPHYNVRLKDDKRYPYIRISLRDPYPLVEVVRRLRDDGARYFGPYTAVAPMRETLQHALRIFQVRTCKLALPEETVPRPCLDYQIGRCSAPCVDYDTQEGYRRRVRDLVRFLEGADDRLLDELRSDMAALAADRRYEEAAAVRDRLAVLEKTVGNLSRIHGLAEDLDACAVVRDGKDGCGVVLRIRGGRVLTTHAFLLEDRLESGPERFLAQLLREYYPRAGDIPGRVLLSHDPGDLEQWAARLTELRGRKVSLTLKPRGARRDALAMAQENAAWKLNERVLKDTLHGRTVAPGRNLALQDALDLSRVPETVSCFDISNFQGRETVASLVFFKDGEPLKSRYRRFKVKDVQGVDDFASMREVLRRHFTRLQERGEAPADLVMVDGGRGQLSAARGVLTELGFHDVELIGLAKREEEIHRERAPSPVRLPRSSPALQLLQRVRDEAHRFAITYHRLLRDQRTTGSALDKIPGIGRVKKLALLHHFPSVDVIRTASAQDLAAVRGLNTADVERILAYFANERGGGA